MTTDTNTPDETETETETDLETEMRAAITDALTEQRLLFGRLSENADREYPPVTWPANETGAELAESLLDIALAPFVTNGPLHSLDIDVAVDDADHAFDVTIEGPRFNDEMEKLVTVVFDIHVRV